MITSRDLSIFSSLTDILVEKKDWSSYKYQMASCLAFKKEIICVGFNCYNKTHPLTPQIKEHTIPIHAEVDCISKFFSNKKISQNYEIQDLSLYVCGLTKSKQTRNFCISSQPCQSCELLIKRFGIKRTVHAENNNQFKLIERKY